MSDYLKDLGIDNFDWSLLIHPAIYILLGFFIYFLLSGALKIFLRADPSRIGEANYQRLRTIDTFGSNVLKYIISLVVGLVILTTYGVDVSSIFAGLGIATAILGLAFQDFAKDIIAGLSILTEQQFKVGDLIEVDGFAGRVIFLGLKTTKIRNYRGQIKIIANRNLSTVINYTQDNSLAQVDLQVAYRHKSEEVEKALEAVKKRLDGTMEQMLDEINIVGIAEMNENGVTWRVNCLCRPYEHFAVQRAIRRAAKAEFDQRGIEIPFAQVTIHHGK